MAGCYFISDIHRRHENIPKFRPQFDSMEEHDEFILQNIKDTLGKRDTLWLLGDCFFTEEAYTSFFEAIHCHKIHWIVGNHDTDNAERLANVKRFCQETYPMFGKVGSLFKYKHFWLSHHPLHPQELRGRINIHGHTHFELMKTMEGIPNPRYVNVCCEHVDYRPIEISVIRNRCGV